MAEVALTLALTKLGPIIEKIVKKEINLHLDAGNDAKKLEQRLKVIQNVLVDAEQKGVTDEEVKSWLATLQNIVYEIEDVLDEWEHERLRQQLEEKEQNAASNQSSSSPDLREKVISFLQSVCSCFNHFCDRRGIALTVRELNEKLDSVKEENEKKFNFVPNLQRVSQKFNKLDSTSQVDEDKVKGRDEDVRILVEKLIKESTGNNNSSGSGNYPQVISVVGAGGMGKTTLAQLVFHNSEVQTCFTDMKKWICVSDPFDQTKIANAILEGLRSPVSPSASLENMLETIRRDISGKKFLLVLNDVWLTKEEIWEPLRICLKKGEPGSKILVTTRNTDVARTMGSTSSDDIHVLKELSVSHCWSILSRIAFQGKTEADRRRLIDVSLGIAEKCKGMPLAAKVMGGLLRSTSDRGRWQSVLESEVWELKGTREEIFPFLRLSYNEIDPVARRCFSYCAIFPKDEQIAVKKLIRMWMAQGFIPGRDAREVEFNAQKYYDDLAARSFFHDFEYDGNRVLTCKMHDIVHDFTQF